VLDGVERTEARLTRAGSRLSSTPRISAADRRLLRRRELDGACAPPRPRPDGDTHYLQRAAALFADIRNGWDTTCCGSKKGGIWWNKAHTQKATASNAGVVILAARLYEHTQLPTDLDFAKQVYAYWFENMVDPSSYQVTDHINPDGTKVFWKFTTTKGS
jgi:hypothetical protein